ncbi:MAG: hypothetical protein IIA87_02090 [Nanoarchaeota archaeon]|nr:hypothetical protein [Nanoarchaeota archaeon]
MRKGLVSLVLGSSVLVGCGASMKGCSADSPIQFNDHARAMGWISQEEYERRTAKRKERMGDLLLGLTKGLAVQKDKVGVAAGIDTIAGLRASERQGTNVNVDFNVYGGSQQKTSLNEENRTEEIKTNNVQARVDFPEGSVRNLSAQLWYWFDENKNGIIDLDSDPVSFRDTNLFYADSSVMVGVPYSEYGGKKLKYIVKDKRGNVYMTKEGVVPLTSENGNDFYLFDRFSISKNGMDSRNHFRVQNGEFYRDFMIEFFIDDKSKPVDTKIIAVSITQIHPGKPLIRNFKVHVK